MKKLSILFLTFLALTSFASAHAGDDDFGHHSMMMGNWMGAGYGMGIFTFIIYFLIIIVLVLLIIWLIKQIQKK